MPKGATVMLDKSMIAVVVLSLVVTVGCAAPPPASDEAPAVYTDIAVPQLVEIMQDEDVILVNVHIPYEGEIPGTELHVPYDDIDALAAALPDKDARIVLYCRSGSMSTTAATRMVDLGYTNLMELDGGMRAYSSAGYELAYR